MKEKHLTELDFDTAMELARTDPEAFEQYRKDVIEALIARAPERNRAANPMSACVKLYRMMWESFAGECGLIDALQNTRNSPHSLDSLRPKAKVVLLPRAVTTDNPTES